MILTCTSCSTRYLVDAQSLGENGRRVRCAKCGHTWFQAPPIDKPPAGSFTPPPAEPRPIPPGSNLPVPREASRGRTALFGWVGLIGLLATLVGGGYAFREPIVAAWEPAARLYEVLGIPVAAPGEGLDIQLVRSEPQTENGRTALLIEGRITNSSSRAQTLPPLMALTRDADKRLLKRWPVPATPDRLLPGEIATFSTRLEDIGPAAELTVTFDRDG